MQMLNNTELTVRRIVMWTETVGIFNPYDSIDISPNGSNETKEN